MKCVFMRRVAQEDMTGSASEDTTKLILAMRLAKTIVWQAAEHRLHKGQYVAILEYKIEGLDGWIDEVELKDMILSDGEFTKEAGDVDLKEIICETCHAYKNKKAWMNPCECDNFMEAREGQCPNYKKYEGE